LEKSGFFRKINFLLYTFLIFGIFAYVGKNQAFFRKINFLLYTFLIFGILAFFGLSESILGQNSFFWPLRVYFGPK